MAKGRVYPFDRHVQKKPTLCAVSWTFFFTNCKHSIFFPSRHGVHSITWTTHPVWMCLFFFSLLLQSCHMKDDDCVPIHFVNFLFLLKVCVCLVVRWCRFFGPIVFRLGGCRLMLVDNYNYCLLACLLFFTSWME
jgi:hypothetical protein